MNWATALAKVGLGLCELGQIYISRLSKQAVLTNAHAGPAHCSAGDMRRVITRTRHHTPKTKLRCRKNSTPRTMYKVSNCLFR